MSGFSAEWLALRETHDVAARSTQAVTTLRTCWNDSRTRRILDLATGTGANLRYLAPRLGGDQQWLLVDHDATLLAAVARHISNWAAAGGRVFSADGAACVIEGTGFSARVKCLRLDLSAEPLNLPLEGVDLVTASALLDLVSHDWLGRLSACCREAGSAMLFALTYDGRVQWRPPDGDDGLLRTLLNRHQETDKGFGPALGPKAAATAAALFTSLDYRIFRAAADWQIGGGDRAIQSVLINDWSTAARETAPSDVSRIDAWRRRRLGLVERGVSRLTVGHTDLLALPGGACRS